MKGIILAGGLGERLRPLTDKTPKPLLLIKGKPIMQYAIENLRDQGITDIILGISFHADKIKEYFGDGSKFGVRLYYSIEEEPLGTAGCLKLLKNQLTETFAMMNGDILMEMNISDMLEIHKKHNASATLSLWPSTWPSLRCWRLA